ncbi:phosphatase PAP2 family protein [Sporichthya polymorpha]|uniref:phosphatase PAP2 family protein n=1 Tax=Sporichthya polymorpha TaxID=35751 RepID=UPI0009FBDE07|nr:phosphatase PAP2 family protein [Sporichthya polymorpha]
MAVRPTASDLPTRSRRTFAGLTQCALVAACAAPYFLTRHVTEGSEERATENAYAILNFEDRLDIAWENSIHSAVVAHRSMTTFFNWVYIWGHWPVILTTLVLLHRYVRAAYTQLRNAMIVSGGIGLLIFARYPVSPPRLLPEAEFVDTVTVWSHSYRVLQPPAFVNQYAAMPSLHVGWNLLVGIVVWRAARHWVLRALAVASPVLMATAVVATANHYVLDVICGTAVALSGYGAVLAYERFRGRSPGSPGLTRPHFALTQQ